MNHIQHITSIITISVIIPRSLPLPPVMIITSSPLNTHTHTHTHTNTNIHTHAHAYAHTIAQGKRSHLPSGHVGLTTSDSHLRCAAQTTPFKERTVSTTATTSPVDTRRARQKVCAQSIERNANTQCECACLCVRDRVVHVHKRSRSNCKSVSVPESDW